MRPKTDERRLAILSAAVDVFRAVGYERASMATISARLGGSKATLYGYYRSKDELFAAAMTAVMEDQAQATVALLDLSEPDVGLALRRFGEALLALLASADALSLLRTAIAEGANSKLGATLYRLGPERALDEIAGYLRQLQKKRLIRGGDPGLAALHLKALLEAGVLEPLLFGAQPRLERRAAVAAAVEAFLSAYGLALDRD